MIGAAWVALCMALPGSSIAAQDDSSGNSRETVLEVRFTGSAAVRGEDPLLQAGSAPVLDHVNLLLEEVDSLGAEPLVHGLSQPEASEIARDAREASGAPTVNMADWYRVTVPSDSATEALEELRSSPIVAHASRASSPPPPPSTPDFSAGQFYLDASPVGVDSRFALADPRTRGAGVKVVDLEYDWTRTHEDLQLPASSDLGGSQYLRYSAFADEHGTAVFGIMVAKDNGFGVTGGVPEASMHGISPTMAPDSAYNPAGALTFIAPQLGPGDVVVIEQQVDGPGPGTSDYVPLEWQQASFDAIRQLTNLGVIVVEAGANGGHDLDAPDKNSKFNRSLRDSGAILVGAGDSATRAPAWYSSRGSRVDLQGPGNNLVTTGGSGDLQGAGPSGLTTRYTSSFGGTSGATPVVANAVVSILSYLKAIGQPPMNSDQIVNLLRLTGVPQAMPELGQIGPLPDIRAAIAALEVNLPSVTISGLLEGDRIDFGSPRNAVFTCNDGGPGLESCVATDHGPGGVISLVNGDPLPTEQPGQHSLTVTVTNQWGLEATKSVSYEVGPGCRVPGPVIAAVEPRGAKVRLLGVADRSLTGSRVKVLRNGRQAGSTKVRTGGMIRVTIKAPKGKKGRKSARYQLAAAGTRSKAARSQTTVKVLSRRPASNGDRVKIKLAGVKKKGRLTLRSQPVCGGNATSRRITHDRRGVASLRLPFKLAAQIYTVTKGPKTLKLPIVLPAG